MWSRSISKFNSRCLHRNGILISRHKSCYHYNRWIDHLSLGTYQVMNFPLVFTRQISGVLRNFSLQIAYIFKTHRIPKHMGELKRLKRKATIPLASCRTTFEMQPSNKIWNSRYLVGEDPSDIPTQTSQYELSRSHFLAKLSFCPSVSTQNICFHRSTFVGSVPL